MEDLILAGVGLFISAGFTWFPPLSTWYYTKVAKEWRGLVMVGIVALVTMLIFGLSCSGLFSWVACTGEGAKALLRGFFIVLVSNQITYQVTPESPSKIAS